MTTPGGVPNLPVGALTLDTLASKTQDMSPSGMRGRADERVSSIFGSSTGGDVTSDLSPLGIISKIFSGFNSVVANADPADVQGPEDLPGLLLDFIEGLPVIGQFVDLLEAILGTYTGDDETLLTVQAIFAPIRAIVEAFSSLGGVDITDPSSILAAIEALASNLGDIILGLFGIDASGDPDPLALLTKLGSNLMSFLGGLNFNQDTSDFNPISAAEQFLQSILTPAGALSSLTQIPAHLLAELGIGQAATNLLPEGGFDDPSVVVGGNGWSFDATKGHTTNGSVWAAAAGVLRQMIGVAIGTNPGDVTDMACWTKWTGVTASTGAAITLCANAYSDAAATMLISDPTNRVVAKISTPGTTSTGFTAVPADGASAADGSGWVQLSGTYQAPAGTMKVRLVLEVESVVTAGSVGFDDCVQTLQNGILDSSLLKNIENIPQLLTSSVSGFSGITDLVNTFQHLLDGLGSAYDTSGPVTGIDFTDLFGLAQSTSQNALIANFQAALHTVILGNRTNKSAGMGANPTSQSSLAADAFSSGGSLTTASLTAGNAVGMRYTVPEAATYGFVEIMAAGTSVTNIFLNIFKTDPVTNAKTALFNSANSASLIPTSNNHVRILLPSMPASLASDELILEIVNNGTNALTLVTKATGIPNNTNEVIQNIGWTRTVAAGGASPTSLTSGQGSYSGSVPYAVIGIASVPANYHPPQPQKYTTAQTGTTLAVPTFMSSGDLIDYAGLAGGGGGGSSLFGLEGQGGGAASWQSGTLVYGVDVKLGTSLTFTVGGRGAGGNPASGARGGDTTITYTDPSNTAHTITSLGGAYGVRSGDTVDPRSTVGNDATGQAAGVATVNGISYFGGASVGAGSTGQSPGAGGGGALPYFNGGSGGVGELDIVFRQV